MSDQDAHSYGEASLTKSEPSLRPEEQPADSRASDREERPDTADRGSTAKSDPSLRPEEQPADSRASDREERPDTADRGSTAKSDPSLRPEEQPADSRASDREERPDTADRGSTAKSDPSLRPEEQPADSPGPDEERPHTGDRDREVIKSDTSAVREELGVGEGNHNICDTVSLNSDGVNSAAASGGENYHTQHIDDVFKPRVRPYKQPSHWEPIEFHLEGGADDELDAATAEKPVFTQEESDLPKFKNGEPDYTGEFLSCFDEPNLLYRIYNREEKTWAFYNDTCSYEMHVCFTFAKLSKLHALGNTKIHTKETGEHVAEVIVYPRETEFFVKGSVNGFTSKLRAIPLSEGYYARRYELANRRIQEEIMNIKAIVGSVTDSEQVLRACVENNIPFVDLEFLPCQRTLEEGGKKPFKRLPWVRPVHCLPDYMANQVRLFRGPIRPDSVDQGELGDSWVTCSMAALTEDPDRLYDMFRHPKDPDMGRRERAVGGYRVALNKNGIWRSVIVDDYLPTSGGKPRYAKSAHDLAEIWPCILEKAFAKLHNSYANICSGDPLHALQDMTGFPCSRFDDAFANAPLSGKDDLFQDWVKHTKSHYQIILSTPGRNPKDKVANDSKLVKRYTSVGLLTGHAYVVLNALFFPEYELRLLKLRNAWGRGSEWNGEWCDGDEKWERYPDVATACCYKDGRNDGTFWMTWEACLSYFNGGGVCFRNNSLSDYRLPSTFVNCVPSCVLEVSVNKPTLFCFTISQKDRRGCPGAREYHPVMISLAQPVEDGLYKIVQNSSADACHPVSDKWTFYQARDISLLYECVPECSPYIVVPRMMQVEAEVADVPYTLSILCSRAVGSDDVTVQLRTIDKDSRVLYNFPKFEPELAPVELEYQAKTVGKAFPEDKVSSTVA
ncbi:unnamed protein product [Trypanosoma congolense IL3000]|uniref:WGS project CAEQ00000000 data, annotated contig 2213 n=1 Tax=Trypanosoma congolense (strain IL3000) TaxID=1068625 RepID=F9WCD1_TRYCI|nr:unnamed protein product [Trypanosoma congolense IL3000]